MHVLHVNLVKNKKFLLSKYVWNWKKYNFAKTKFKESLPRTNPPMQMSKIIFSEKYLRDGMKYFGYNTFNND